MEKWCFLKGQLAAAWCRWHETNNWPIYFMDKYVSRFWQIYFVCEPINQEHIWYLSHAPNAVQCRCQIFPPGVKMSRMNAFLCFLVLETLIWRVFLVSMFLLKMVLVSTQITNITFDQEGSSGIRKFWEKWSAANKYILRFVQIYFRSCTNRF